MPFPDAESITPLQMRILELKAQGNSYSDIGSVLERSQHYCKRQGKQILDILGADDMTHAVGLAYRRGLLKPDH